VLIDFILLKLAGISTHNRGNPMFVPRGSAEQRQLCRVSKKSKLGTSKMNRRDQLETPRNDGAIAVLLAVMFVVGMAIGGVLSEPQSETTQIASMD
jgi:hypothetical protein